MRLLYFFASLALFFEMTAYAEPPGATTQGEQYRLHGRIVSKPKVYNPTPYYYQGNLIYEGEGRSYRDRNGKIRYENSYTEYPYRRPNINYEKERERLSDKENAREQRIKDQSRRQNKQAGSPPPQAQVQPQPYNYSKPLYQQDRQKTYEDKFR